MISDKVPTADDIAWVARELTAEWCKLKQERQKWEHTHDDDDDFDDDPPSTECFYNNLHIIMEHLSDLRMLHSSHDERVGFVLYRDRETSDTECDMLWIHPELRGFGYGEAFVREIHFRVLCTNGRVRFVRATEGSVGFWKKLGYQEISSGDVFSDPILVAVLRPEEYVIQRGFMEVVGQDGQLFDRAAHGKALSEELEKWQGSHDLLRSEGGVEFDHGGQIRYGKETFHIKRLNLHQLFSVLSDFDRAGWACRFYHREAQYTHRKADPRESSG